MNPTIDLKQHAVFSWPSKTFVAVLCIESAGYNQGQQIFRYSWDSGA
jgi:hypothetical protein